LPDKGRLQGGRKGEGGVKIGGQLKRFSIETFRSIVWQRLGVVGGKKGAKRWRKKIWVRVQN